MQPPDPFPPPAGSASPARLAALAGALTGEVPHPRTFLSASQDCSVLLPAALSSAVRPAASAAGHRRFLLTDQRAGSGNLRCYGTDG
jgi:hypothetical protein